MGVHIRYMAKRNSPLKEEEEQEIRDLIEEAGPAPEEDEEQDEDEPMAEPFSVNQFDLPNYQASEKGEILYGNTKVTTDEQIDHWLDLLTDIRSVLPDAQWKVTLEGAEFPWNEGSGSYDYPED